MSASAAKHEVKEGWRGRLVPWTAVLGVAAVLGWLGLTWYGFGDSAVYEQWAEIRAQYGALMAQGRPAEALALLRRPQDWPAEIQVSRVLLEKDGLLVLGRREEAQALLEQAAKDFPSDPVLLNDLGLLYFEKRLFASAAAVLAQGAALVPDDARLAGNAWMAKVNLALEEAEIQKMVLMSLHRQVEAGLASQGAWVAASH